MSSGGSVRENDEREREQREWVSERDIENEMSGGKTDERNWERISETDDYVIRIFGPLIYVSNLELGSKHLITPV